MREKRIVRAIILAVSAMTLSACAVLESEGTPGSTNEFQYTLSSGMFSLPQGAQSVDWAVINNSDSVQTFRVTVYQWDSNGRVPVAPGPVSNSLEPFHTFHNANSVGYDKPFKMGWDYEVVVEVNSMKVLPTAEVWANHGNTVIPGTSIGPGQFVDISDGS